MKRTWTSWRLDFPVPGSPAKSMFGLVTEPGLVGLEGVEGEPAAAGEHVGAEVDAAVTEPGFGQERVGAGTGGRWWPRWRGTRSRRLTWSEPPHGRATPDRQRADEAEVVAAVEARSSSPACAATCSYSAHDRSSVVRSAAVTVTKPDELQLGVAGDEFRLAFEHGGLGSAVPGADAEPAAGCVAPRRRPAGSVAVDRRVATATAAPARSGRRSVGCRRRGGAAAPASRSGTSRRGHSATQ